MAINRPGPVYECHTCRARWSDGRWTWNCEECGGGSMEKPCELCMVGCGGSFNRATMDSNDSGRAEFFGSCRDLTDIPTRVARFASAKNAAIAFHGEWIRLRAELIDWSNDEIWAANPNGPQRLEVLRDAVEEAGVSIQARVLAHALFDWEKPTGAGLKTVQMAPFWSYAGSLVVLERPIVTTADTHGLIELKVRQVIDSARTWLTGMRNELLPCVVDEPLEPGGLYVGILAPTNQVAGMRLTAGAVRVTEAELPATIDWHRELVARGE